MISYPTLSGLLYLEINLISVIVIFLVRIRTLGISRMARQVQLSMAIDSEVIFFLSDTFCVLMTTGILPWSSSAFFFLKAVYFFSTCLMCYFWCMYFETILDAQFTKHPRGYTSASVLAVLLLLLEIVNVFTHMFFYIKDGTYHRGPLFLLQYVLAYIYVLIPSVHALILLNKNDGRQSRKALISYVLFPLIPGTAGLLQLFYPQIPAACAAMSLSTLILYLNWVENLISLDPLTQLNNRKQLNHVFSQWKKDNDPEKIMLLMIDADHFKSINDTYGHASGDAALCRIAQAMRRSVQDNNLRTCLARFGGDEFVILARTGEEKDALLLEESMRENLARISREEPAPWNVSVSIGSALAQKNDTLADLMIRADRMMYTKKKYHPAL